MKTPTINRDFCLKHLAVILVDTRNPLNIGAAARAMSNFGCSDLRLVRPYSASFREARSAVGADELLRSAREYETISAAVADCALVVGTTSGDRRQLQHELKSLDRGAKLIQRELASAGVGVLFGSEKRGLSNEDFSHCHWLMRIPTRHEHGSMNLGQAVAVCLYEIAGRWNELAESKTSRGGGSEKRTKAANQAQLQRVIGLLLECLSSSGYLENGKSISSVEKVRRQVLRLGLSATDAELWLGMLRQILWKLKKEK